METRVLAFCDTIWASAHQGHDKTLEKIQRKFYWTKMEEFVNKYCNECLSCLAYKNPKQWAKAKLSHIECSGPWDLVCIDLQTGWPRSSKGYRNTLTVICGFSKFVFIIPCKSKKAAYIAKKLFKHVFAILGFPA